MVSSLNRYTVFIFNRHAIYANIENMENGWCGSCQISDLESNFINRASEKKKINNHFFFILNFSAKKKNRFFGIDAKQANSQATFLAGWYW